MAHRFFCAQMLNFITMYNKKNEALMIGQFEVFNFNGEQFRAQKINDDPWFVATDVCQILGISNNRDAVSRLDDDERMDGVGITDTVGRRNYVTIVSESGLYALIFQSRKPEARKFRKLVTSEILPSIRKTGMYAVPQRRKAVALLPKDRGQKWEQFYTELARYTTREDEELVAGLMNVTRRHVHEVAMGRKPAYGVCCMLVDCAKANREKGIERMTANRSVDMEELRLELMSAINPQEA